MPHQPSQNLVPGLPGRRKSETSGISWPVRFGHRDGLDRARKSFRGRRDEKRRSCLSSSQQLGALATGRFCYQNSPLFPNIDDTSTPSRPHKNDARGYLDLDIQLNVERRTVARIAVDQIVYRTPLSGSTRIIPSSLGSSREICITLTIQCPYSWSVKGFFFPRAFTDVVDFPKAVFNSMFSSTAAAEGQGETNDRPIGYIGKSNTTFNNVY
ncbi:hypothetical protein PM082_007942 [Marasmius tenuissimus]|nr:hypothetical protein PM082_007942 [Marasmius tenuissimus]